MVVEDPDTSAEIGAVIVDLPLELGRGFVQGLMGPGALADAVTAVAW